MPGYDPTAPDVLADPYPAYAWLRDQAPLYYSEPHDLWVLSRLGDVRDGLRDHRRLSSSEGIGYEPIRVPLMITSDPPDHTRLRRAVSTAFTPRHITAHEPHIRKLVEELIDPALDGAPFDVATTISYQLPTRIIADLLGVPDELLPAFRRWSEDTISALSGAGGDDEWDSISEAFGYFINLLKETGVAGRDNLVGLLASQVPDELADFELASFCLLLLVAGTATTAHVTGN